MSILEGILLIWGGLPILLVLAATVTHVELQCHAIVADGEVELSHRIIATPTVEVGIRIVRVYLYHTGEVTDSFFVKRESFIGDAAVVKGMNVFRI